MARRDAASFSVPAVTAARANIPIPVQVVTAGAVLPEPGPIVTADTAPAMQDDISADQAPVTSVRPMAPERSPPPPTL